MIQFKLKALVSESGQVLRSKKKLGQSE